MYQTIEILRDGPVATLWMNRPNVHNAFNADLVATIKFLDIGSGTAKSNFR